MIPENLDIKMLTISCNSCKHALGRVQQNSIIFYNTVNSRTIYLPAGESITVCLKCGSVYHTRTLVEKTKQGETPDGDH